MKLVEKLKHLFYAKKQKALILNFNAKKQEILEKNSRYIIEEKLVPYIISDTLYRENYLMSEEQAYKIATQMFLEAKESGRIDCLNRLNKEIA